MNKIATASPSNIEGTIYTVTYPHSADMDRDVGYAYLRLLARDGYTVHVGATPDVAAYTILPEVQS